MNLEQLKAAITNQKPDLQQEVHLLVSQPMNKIILAFSLPTDNLQWDPQEAMKGALQIIEGCKQLGVKVTGEIAWE